MKKKLFVFIMLLSLAACARAEHYKTPFDTGGRVYKVALMTWYASPMGFDLKFRWTMTQALSDACRQAGAFDLYLSTYPVNGGEVKKLDSIDRREIWERKQYGRYEPDVQKVRQILSGSGVDLALLYNIAAENVGSKGPESLNTKDDYIRLFLVDVKSGQVVTEFVRTDFLRNRAYADAKLVTLRAFNKWLNPEK